MNKFDVEPLIDDRAESESINRIIERMGRIWTGLLK